MHQNLRLIVFCLFLSFSAICQPKLIEKIVRKPGGEWVIPYERYQLPNGLTVILHEDHSDPLVHVDVTYHVGSAREEIGKSGFAHFFEHMMFQGSDHVGDEEHFKIITEAGGTLNGTTNRDRTNYYETVPANQLEKMLWLEADRMGFLLDAVTPKKFEVQRATVKNERGQNYDNRPYGLVGETLSRNLFPYGHPYSWLTIGYVEELNRVTVDDLKNFFLRWYGPNNAVLTIGGDFQTKQVLDWVQKYFGSIPAGPAVTKTQLPAPVLEKDRYVSMTDPYARMPMLTLAFPGVPSNHPDEKALDCLTEILGGSKTSLLYQRLVKTQKAVRANMFHWGSELAGQLQVTILPKPGTPLADMEKEFRALLDEFEKRGVSDEDIEKYVKSQEANFIMGLESVSGKVSYLAESFTFTGNPNQLPKDLKEYRDLKKADVVRVFNTYVKGKPMVILSTLTKGLENVAAGPENYKVDSTRYKAPDYGYKGLVYKKAKDNFDRSKMPPAGANPAVKEPVFSVKEMGGMKRIFSQSDEIPLVTLNLHFPGGGFDIQAQPEKVGIANLFSSMMNEDNQLYSAEEMTSRLDKLGTRMSFYAVSDGYRLSLTTLKKNLNASLDLVEARLLKPRFLPEAFDRIRNQTLEGIKNQKTQASAVASIAFNRLVYGPGHPQGLPVTEKSIQAVSLADLEALYKKRIQRKGLEVVVVGDLSEAEADQVLTRFMALPEGEARSEAYPAPAAAAPKPGTIYLVDVPKAAQTEFRIGYGHTTPYNPTGDYFRLYLANYPFGGAFNSRINLKLREDKGWTYGARSSYGADKTNGTFEISTGIRAEATDSALVEILADLGKYHQQGASQAEVDFMKNSLGQSEALRYETGGQKAGFVGNILKFGLPPGFMSTRNKILANSSPAELLPFVKQGFDPGRMHILLAGDKARIGPALEKRGYTIVELTPEGDPKP